MANGIPRFSGDRATTPTDPGDIAIFVGAYLQLEDLLERTMTHDYTREWKDKTTWDIEPADDDLGRRFNWDPTLLGEESFGLRHINMMHPSARVDAVNGIRVNVDLTQNGLSYFAPEDVEWVRGIYPDLDSILQGNPPASSGYFRPWYSIHFVPEGLPFMFHWTRMEVDMTTLSPNPRVRGTVREAVDAMRMLGQPPIHPSAQHVSQLIAAIDGIKWVVDPYG